MVPLLFTASTSFDRLTLLMADAGVDQRAVLAHSRWTGAQAARAWAVTLAGAASAAAFGVLAAHAPRHAVIALGLAVVVPVALLAPLACLSLVLFLAVLVPQGGHELLSVGAGPGRPALALVDVLLILGLLRVGLVGLRRDWGWPYPIGVALLVAVAAQTAHGVVDGWPLGEVGQEARRATLGAGGFVLAIPVLHDPAARRRLLPVLLALGGCLGVWGLAQWLLHVDFAASADVGVREGVALTSGGRGQLQGGLYAYPVAVVIAFSVLASGHVAGARERAAVAVVLALNGVCLVLTYERTFWAAAALGCLFVLLLAGPAARRRASLWTPPAVIVAVVLAAAVAPGELRTAVERFASITQYETDSSLEFREEESRAVMSAIRDSPAVGSGLGAAVTWGHEWRFGRQETAFAHVGYLWLAWKVGVPLGLAIVALLAATAFRRDPTRRASTYGALRTGAQASILALLLVNLTFPSFNALGVTALTGLLVAVAWVPRRARPGAPVAAR